MTHAKRCKGYVVGVDIINNREVWKVRVQEVGDTSQRKLKGLKLEVASIREGIKLAEGLDVSFIIGTVKQKFLKAIDVDVDLLL